MKNIIVIGHETPVDRDNGIRHLERRGFAVRSYRPDQGEDLPPLDEQTAGVVVLGGPQYVSDLDRFPYLRDEMAYIGEVLKADVPLLGICLGGQLIAAHLGGTVDFHPNGNVAFGYYPLQVTDDGKHWIPDDLTVLAGNAQGFSCPGSATLLASGDVFPNQAFSYGAATIALQFHPEVTRRILDQWQDELAGNIGKPGTQTLDQQDRGFERHNDRLTQWYQTLLDRLF
ncbi:MAG: gamma-glutamyl-gamma-aminobutyrate hydrolase family protein [Alphaproteobacteria bacterium]|nr:gamma-glutamyl-gamma-aminobutyrate hydrolase family protein [Alphaproteobacteria bacterium]